MKKSYSITLMLILISSLTFSQTKLGGTAKIGGKANASSSGFNPTALRFDGNSSNALDRTTGLFDYNSTYSCMGYVRIVTDTNATATVFNLGNNSLVSLDTVQTLSNGTSIITGSCNAGTCNQTASSSLTVGQWYHWALVRTSTTNINFYIDGNLVGSSATNVAGRVAQTNLDVGRTNCCSGFTGEPLNGRVAAVKCWTSAFSEAQVEAEMNNYSAIAASPWGVWTLQATGADSSGNGRNFTTIGTLNVESGPPIVQ